MDNCLPSISVIVPVYNGEEYLQCCLNSILTQSFNNIEIIIIDDCSTDKTREIIEGIVSNDSRCHAIYEDENRGAGPCRNDAIQIARGKYLSFVDSDDIVHPHMLQIAFETAERNLADVVEFGYSSVECSAVFFSPVEEFDHACVLFEKREIAENIDCFDDISCNKLIRRSLVVNNNIRFVGRVYEDTHFSKMALLSAVKVAKIHQKLYFYIKRTTSNVNTFSLDKMEILFLRNAEVEKLYDQYEVPVRIQDVIRVRSTCFILRNLLDVPDYHFKDLRNRFSKATFLPSVLVPVKKLMLFCDNCKIVKSFLKMQLFYFKLRRKMNNFRR